MFLQNKTNQLTKEIKIGANTVYNLLLVLAYLRKCSHAKKRGGTDFLCGLCLLN